MSAISDALAAFNQTHDNAGALADPVAAQWKAQTAWMTAVTAALDALPAAADSGSINLQETVDTAVTAALAKLPAAPTADELTEHVIQQLESRLGSAASAAGTAAVAVAAAAPAAAAPSESAADAAAHVPTIQPSTGA